ncbi:MAG: hypothetical protein WAU45_22600 [Blastocatellia bacterium]
MIAFEILRDDERVCLAGVENGVLTAMLSWVSCSGELILDVGGLEAGGDEGGQQLRWLNEQLEPGATVSIRVLETLTADAPLSREPQDPEFAARHEREYYERLRKKYGDGTA